MRLLLLPGLLAIAALAAQEKADPAPKTAKEAEIEALVSRLAALPFEIEADSLLMLIGAGQIPVSTVPDMLDRLFVDAGRASIKSRVDTTLPAYSGTSGSVPSAISLASRALGLDQLSLQTRIVARVKELDLKHAVELFDSIQVPQAPRACIDPYMLVLDTYYLSLLTLYREQAKSSKPKIREDAGHWLNSHLGVTQEAQIAPAANLIAKLTGEDAAKFALGRFSQDLRQIKPSFLPYLESLPKVTDAVIALSKRAADLGVSQEALWRGFTAYNRSALTGSRCAAMPSEEIGKILKPVQEKLASVAPPQEDAEAIAGWNALEPGGVDDSQPPYKTFHSDSTWRSLQILEYQNLRFGPLETRRQFVGKPRPDGLTSFIPLEERKSHQWDERATKYLRDIEDYAKHSDDDPLTSFIKVSGLYTSLIEILPLSANTFSNALNSFIAYLSATPVMKQQPLVWYVQVKLFLRRGSLDEHEKGQERVRAAIRQQGNQVLNTILDADRYNSIRSNSNMSTLYVP